MSPLWNNVPIQKFCLLPADPPQRGGQIPYNLKPKNKTRHATQKLILEKTILTSTIQTTKGSGK